MKDKPKTLRGGSFGSVNGYANCVYRFWVGPNDRISYFGFRLVATPKKEEERRALRGGSLDDDYSDLHYACRDRGSPSRQYSDLGFRLIAIPKNKELWARSQQRN